MQLLRREGVGLVKPVLAADSWPTNADLIADAMKLANVDRETVKAIDLTHNTGKWWKVWRPASLIANDLDPRYGHSHVDYRKTEDWDGDLEGRFGLVAFDPPYASTGGRTTTSIDPMNASYGMTTSAKTPAENQEWINAGLSTASLICAPGGVILCKVMNYISSGKLWPGVYLTMWHAETLPLAFEAIYTHVGQPGPQPTTNPDGSPRKQKSPRNNASTLLVLRKNKK